MPAANYLPPVVITSQRSQRRPALRSQRRPALRPALRAAYELLVGTLKYHVDRRLTLENAKARVLAVLEEGPLTNADVREIT